MKIYVASSWRNLLQPAIVLALQRCGHRCYDFKNPIPDWTGEGLAPPEAGFAWSSIDPNWKNWTAAEYRQALQHPCEGLRSRYRSSEGLRCVRLGPSLRSLGFVGVRIRDGARQAWSGRSIW